MRRTASIRTALFLLVPLAATFAIFLPVTAAYFHRDDFLHLVAVNNNPLGTVIWQPFMGHLYALPRLMYALLLATAGPTPEPYFWFALVLHLLNTALLFALARALTDSPRIASVMALLWGTAAFHTFTLSYFCLHAHVLVGLAMLLALRGLAIAERGGRSSAWQAVWWACLVFGASLSYGTGLVLALTFPFIALLVFGGRLPRRLAVPLWALPVAVVLVYAVVRATSGVSSYGSHRLEAGLRASLLDPWSVFLMWGHCLLYVLSTLGSFVPGLPPYPSIARLVIGGVLALLLLIGCVRRSPSRRWIIALLLFALACYAVTAVTPAYERRIFRQAVTLRAQDHRYHYAPSIALALCLAMLVREYGRHLVASRRIRDVAWLLCCLLILATQFSTRRAIDLHPQNRLEVQQVLQQAQSAADAAPLGSTVRIPETRFRGGFGLWPSKLTSAGVLTLFFPTGEVAGRRIRYVAPPDRPPLGVAADSPLARIVIMPPAPATEAEFTTEGTEAHSGDAVR
jgi:hypothetical protein